MRFDALTIAVTVLLAVAVARVATSRQNYVNAPMRGRHAPVAQSFRQTAWPVARSLAREHICPDAAPPSYFPRFADHFTAGATGYFQGRYQTGFDGKTANVMEKEIHYVMGSGSQVRTYLHRTAANKLIELPLSWYAEKGGSWAMSPGFDRPAHPGFGRAISQECMFCHNAYPAEAPDRRGEDPVFPGALPVGIDCQRCHGPGSEHVRLAQRTSTPAAEVRGAIVNPGRLPDRHLEVWLSATWDYQLAAARRDGPVGALFPPSRRSAGDFKLYFDLHFRPAVAANRNRQLAYRLRQSAASAQRRKAAVPLAVRIRPPRRRRAKPCRCRRNCHAATLDRLATARAHPRRTAGCHARGTEV
jgi:hypothetical protein